MNSLELPEIEDTKNQIFNRIWELVDESYVLFKNIDIEWNAIRIQYEKLLYNIHTYQSLYELIDRMLLELRDPHTRVVWSPHTDILGVMPLVLRYIDGEYFIASDIEECNLSVGMRVLSINDVSMKEVESKVLEKYLFQSMSARRLSFMSDIIKGDLGHCLKVKALSPSGKEVVRNLGFQSASKGCSDVKQTAMNLSMCVCEEYDSVGYVKIINFRSKRVVEDFKQALLKLNKQESLMIDIRGNDGGFIQTAMDAASIIAKKEIHLGYKVQRKPGETNDEFEKVEEVVIKPAAQMEVGNVSEGVAHHYKKIIILCDEFTMSSAEFIFLAALKNSDERILVVGEKTGGLPFGASVFTLFDGTKVQITTSKYLNAQGAVIAEEGIFPDVFVSNTEEILTSNKDDQLEYALRICRN